MKSDRIFMGSLIGYGLMFTLFFGCDGVLSSRHTDAEVARFSLTANSLGALQVQECTSRFGAEACAQYPNPKGCSRLGLTIWGDGAIEGLCELDGTINQLMGLSEGVPLACRIKTDSGCLQCIDLYGEVLVNQCKEDFLPFQGMGLSATEHEGNGNEDFTSPTAQEEAPTSGGDEYSPLPANPVGPCDPVLAQKFFIERFNQILVAEKLPWVYQPDLSQLASGGGFFEDKSFWADTFGVCGINPEVQFFDAIDLAGQECDHDAAEEGRCFCSNGFFGTECRCARITSKVLIATCKELPAECNTEEWDTAIWQVYSDATRWLNQDPFDLFMGGNEEVTGGSVNVSCKGSPLVLDLEGDGISLSSVEEGVNFNLTGAGVSRVAWLKSADDALLAIDLDGDGVITHGGELFGEAPGLAAAFSKDGFQALGLLDRGSHGGNENGMIEAGDLMFDQLLLWSDKNGDGISQGEELVSLASAGVAALNLAATDAGSILDQHGNDLSLRSSFIRIDGSTGLVVDALFMTRNP